MSEPPSQNEILRRAQERHDARQAARAAEIAAEETALKAKIERFLSAAKNVQAKRAAIIELWTPQIEAAPLARCPDHPCELPHDVELSAIQSQKAGRLAIVSGECPMCRERDAIRRAESRLLRQGIPPRQLHVRLSTWDANWEPTFAAQRAAALAAVAEWVKARPNPFLIILGARGGTGKTALGVAALRACSTDIRFVQFRDLMDQLLGMDFSLRPAEISSLRQVGALMIDDVGNRQTGAKDGAGGNAFERDVMGQLLEHRFESRLPTILTSNLDPMAFAGRLDDRTVSRIKPGRLLIEANDWPSKREADGGI